MVQIYVFGQSSLNFVEKGTAWQHVCNNLFNALYENTLLSLLCVRTVVNLLV